MKNEILKRIIFIISAFILLVMGIVGVIRLVAGGGEDTWICVQGEWIKHGQPNSPPPGVSCREER